MFAATGATDARFVNTAHALHVPLHSALYHIFALRDLLGHYCSHFGRPKEVILRLTSGYPLALASDTQPAWLVLRCLFLAVLMFAVMLTSD